MRLCSEHKRSLYRQLYDVTVHGKCGGYEVARRMPVELRNFWIEQVIADREPKDGGGR